MSTAGIIGGFQPVHNGTTKIIREMCIQFDKVIIGIGSANRFDMRNPFRWTHRKNMILKITEDLTADVSFVLINDYGHEPEFRDGQKWVNEVITKFGELDIMVTGNQYVKSLLQDHYTIKHPMDIVGKNNIPEVRASEIRLYMAKNSNFWKNLVNIKVYNYIKNLDLDEELRYNYGEEILKENFNVKQSDILENEKEKINGVKSKDKFLLIKEVHRHKENNTIHWILSSDYNELKEDADNHEGKGIGRYSYLFKVKELN